jgi:hypothetical protein
MITMAEAGSEFNVKDEDGEYRVSLPEGNHLLFVITAEYGSPAAKFDSDRILKTQRRIMNFKHYSNTRKWWTQKPGIDFWFAVHKDKIFMVEEKGYSYVPIEIGGKVYRINASGGTDGKGWTDWVSHGCHLGVTKTRKMLDEIAQHAEHRRCVEVIGPTKVMSDSERDEYRSLCAFYDTRGKLQEGAKVVLRSWYDVDGSQGPFDIVHRRPRKRSFVCTGEYTGNFKVSYKHVDWKKTAEVNGVSLVF